MVESGYHAIAGSKFLSSEEVAYLLSLKKPGMCLSDYRLSRKYLQIINKNGDFSVEFRDKYASLQSRKVRKIVYLFLYFFLVFIGISPLFLPSKYTPLIFITLLVFGYYAFMSIISYIKIRRGEHLEKHQQSHTQKILRPIGNSASLK